MPTVSGSRPWPDPLLRFRILVPMPLGQPRPSSISSNAPTGQAMCSVITVQLVTSIANRTSARQIERPAILNTEKGCEISFVPFSSPFEPQQPYSIQMEKLHRAFCFIQPHIVAHNPLVCCSNRPSLVHVFVQLLAAIAAVSLKSILSCNADQNHN